jgi:hypothetical protein
MPFVTRSSNRSLDYSLVSESSVQGHSSSIDNPPADFAALCCPAAPIVFSDAENKVNSSFDMSDSNAMFVHSVSAAVADLLKAIASF